MIIYSAIFIAVGNNNPTFKDPVPPTQPGNVANRFDRSHFYKPATKLPEINNVSFIFNCFLLHRHC